MQSQKNCCYLSFYHSRWQPEFKLCSEISLLTSKVRKLFCSSVLLWVWFSLFPLVGAKKKGCLAQVSHWSAVTTELHILQIYTPDIFTLVFNAWISDSIKSVCYWNYWAQASSVAYCTCVKLINSAWISLPSSLQKLAETTLSYNWL